MKDWKECKLGDVAEIIDCEHKTAPIVERSNFLSIRTTDIKNGKINFQNANRVSEQTYIEWTKRKRPQAGDIIFAREAPVGEVGWIDEKHRICLGQRTVLLRADNIKIDSRYLLYKLVNNETKFDLINQSSGSVVAHLNVKNIRDFSLIIHPNINEQRVIAAILSSLDDKIDLLNRQNKTLEAMAETLFKQWFVEEVSEDWETVKIGDFIKTNVSSISKDFKHKTIKYLDTGSLTEGKRDSYEILELADAPSRAKRIIKHNDILISTVRPNQKHYGIVKHPDDDIIVSTGFCVITCEKIDPHFVYVLLTTDEMTEYLHSIAEGSTSTYPSLKPSDIESLVFQLPPIKKLNAFSDYADNAWSKIDSNNNQIRTLEKLRDNLLPKLMSGEVRVAV